MTPNINPSDPPQFHRLGEYPFQELCHDIFEVQNGIATCEIYGRRGQAQKGIDLLASCDDGESTEVGQCKAEKSFSVSKIIAASEEFFEYWEFWKEKKVRRFILFVGCPLDDPKVLDEVQTQRARFQKVGIGYEVWSARTLVTRLRPHRAIAERHIRSREIVDNICGRSFESPSKAPTKGMDLALSLLGSQVEVFSTEFSQVNAQKLERIRELSREGKVDEAYEQILEMRRDKTWEMLEKPLRARILRVHASLVLNVRKGVAEAKTLKEQAAALDPDGDESTLSALIRHYEEGNEAALEELTEPVNINAFNLKIGLLIELARPDEALAMIQQPPAAVEPDADTERLHALLLLLEGDLGGAQEKIDKALERQPGWQGVRHASAIVNYYSALSDAALPKRFISWPSPIPWPLVKRDDQSQDRLRNAESHFARLAADAEHNDEQRNAFNIWRLACLANDVSRQEEAAQLCLTLLSDNPVDSHTLAWALSRHYDVDLKTMEESLERALGVDLNDDSY
jgi:tetratricopeptide (TPR) repeat protein